MRSLLHRRPSASMVVSLIALVVASSGTAVAATHLVNGDTLIRKGTLSGNRLHKHTLTGTQINMKKLGKVPRARSADTAGSAGYASHAASADTATSAVTATNAANATNAGNAATLGGQPASSFLTAGSRIGTNGVVKVPGSAAGNTVTLFSHGPFTVTLTCTTSGNLTSMEADATSAESNSVIDGDYGVSSDNLNQPSFSQNPQITGGTYTFEAPNGAAMVLGGSFGTNSLGISHGCWANFAGIA
jgi:hypothetical protein